MGYATSILTTLRGVDQTAGAFNSATNNAAKFRGKLESTLSGATGKAGSLFSSLGASAVAATAAIGGTVVAIKKVIDTAKEMSRLTDLAAAASTSTGQLQQLAGALTEIGVKGADVEGVSAMLAEMTKRAGLVGVEGFGTALKYAAQFETEQERITALTEIFGKSHGAALAMVIRDGEAGIETIARLGGAYTVASEEAMNAGDRLADSWGRATSNMRNAWYEFVGTFLNTLYPAVDAASGETAAWAEGLQAFAHGAGKALGGLALVVEGIRLNLQHAFESLFLLFRAETWTHPLETLGTHLSEVGQDWGEHADKWAALWDGTQAGEVAEKAAEKTRNSIADILEGAKRDWDGIVKEDTAKDEKAATRRPRRSKGRDTWKLLAGLWEKYETELGKRAEQAAKVYDVGLGGVARKGSHEAQVALWRAGDPNAQWSDKVEAQQLNTQRQTLQELKAVASILTQGFTPLKALAVY